MDSLDEDFRPTQVMSMLTTDDPWMIQRYFVLEASMFSTFLPLSNRVKDHGMDCSKSRKVLVKNPYYIFNSSRYHEALDEAVVTIDALEVFQNQFHQIRGGFVIDLAVFSLTAGYADNIFLRWLPNNYGNNLAKLGFPHYAQSRNTIAGMFALDFMKSYATFSTTCYRGFLVVCRLLQNADLAATEGQEVDMVNSCASQPMLNTMFHDENVITSLLTVSPSSVSPFEVLRANVEVNMQGFSFWGLQKPQEEGWDLISIGHPSTLE